jgi:Phage portal protein, lambda family
MNLIEKIFGKGKVEESIIVEESNSFEAKSSSSYNNVSYGYSYPIVNKKWDGEKTLGELGVIIRNVPDYERLRLRSYNAYATIDTVKIIASKFFYWKIGSGLKLQIEPNRNVLESEGIKNDDAFYTKFQKLVESRFMVYANSKNCDYLKEKSLHELALDFDQATFLGGDTLAIIRVESTGVNIQFISGDHIRNPEIGSKYFGEATVNGNYIEDGIEVDSKGMHIAYYVNVKTNSNELITKYERIPAIGSKSKKRVAWMIYGNKISPDHKRGVPAMAQSLEKINKLDRYTEAAVTKAEQAAKIVYSIEHEEFSTGESHLQNIIAKKRGETISDGIGGDYTLADGLANKITETTSGQTFNMPNGASLKSFSTEIETGFSEFNATIFKQISAGQDVPPEVAMQEYNSNYSASRAAINSFGHIISIKRTKFANDFYVPFFKFWLEYEILNNKIQAPGYIENIDNFMVTESYAQCRFMGKNVPHIDPLKEIKAVREMLGIDGAIPLISREQATEMLGAGQWDENFMKSLEEENLIPKEDLIVSKNKTNTSNEKTDKVIK